MSDTFLKFIPIKPDYIPNISDQGNIENYLEDIFKGNNIKLATTDDVEFIDQGANFESISCNFCEQSIDIQTWHDVMDNLYDNHFKTLDFITPCCNKQNNLNDLKYNWPAGFSKFSISIQNPSITLNEEQRKNLERLLNAEVREIWSHY